MEKRLTVREIADLAGVSVATVSRVINQNGRFSPETEERVKRVIREHHYQPNQLARGLRVNKARAIGVIIPDITNALFAQITLEIQKRLLEREYLTLICNTDEMAELERKQLRMLYAQQVSGIIYVSGGLDEPWDESVPTVFIDRKPLQSRGKNCVFIESDNETGGRLAAAELLERGCKRIALITYDEGISTYGCRGRGFREAAREAGVECRKRRVGAVTQEAGFDAMRDLLAGDGEIDGVFCASDALAIGAVQYCCEAGVKIPERMRIVGFDDVPQCQMIYPALTSVHQSVADFARIAVRTILAQIDGEQPEALNYRLPVELVRRGTT